MVSIFSLLTTKSNVRYLEESMTIEKGLSSLNECGYTAVPVIDSDGKYICTVTEGDFLRYMYACDFNTELMSENYLSDLPVRREILPVHVNADLNSLVECAKTQNFVPVVDDRGIFIGIVTRKDLIVYAIEKVNKMKKV